MDGKTDYTKFLDKSHPRNKIHERVEIQQKKVVVFFFVLCGDSFSIETSDEK